MTARLVNLGGANYWAGLEWETISSSEKPKVRLKELAEHTGPKGLRCVRARGGREVVSIGFSEPPDMSYRKAASLAAAVADARREPWMGMFELPDGEWWFVAVRVGQSVIPGGDVIGTREEVEAARLEVRGLGDWNDEIEGDALILMDLIREGREESGAPAMVHQMRSKAPLYAGFAAAVLVVGAVAMGFYSHEMQVRQQKEDAARRAAMLAAARAKLKAHKAIVVVPWIHSRPREAIASCADAVATLPIVRAGWSPSSVTCSASEARVLWVRQRYGTASDSPVGQLSNDGDKVTNVVRLPSSTRGQNHSVPLAQEVLLRTLFGIAQSGDMRLVPMQIAPKATLPGAAKSASAWRPYVKGQFKVTNVGNSDQILAFAEVPTVLIDSMSVQGLPGKPIWSLTFSVWHKNPSPRPSQAR